MQTTSGVGGYGFESWSSASSDLLSLSLLISETTGHPDIPNCVERNVKFNQSISLFYANEPM